ncbi:hypothetical protein ACFL2P_02055 [Candidatus Moduliflexota bacterium]
MIYAFPLAPLQKVLRQGQDVPAAHFHVGNVQNQLEEHFFQPGMEEPFLPEILGALPCRGYEPERAASPVQTLEEQFL